MYDQQRRTGLHPGKMPDGLKLVDCIEDLRELFRRMTITDRDRDTRAFRGMTGLAAAMEFWDPAQREPYVNDWYLGDEAINSVKAALSSGLLPTWTDYDGQFIELDHQALFSPNRWNSTQTVQTGKYAPLNVAHDHDGSLRQQCENATLWVRELDWPVVRDRLIAQRECSSGSELAPEWRTLLAARQPPVQAAVPAIAADVPSGPQWSLYEAVAWIATGDPALVEQQSVHFAQHRREGKEAGRLTWTQLQQVIKGQHCTCGRDWLDCTCIDDARERLRAQCEAGEVRSSGVPRDCGPRRPIPPTDFISVELFPGDGATLHRITRGIGEAFTWSDLRFAVPDVQALGRKATVADVPITATSYTGAPGRPTSKHLVTAEFARRVKAGKAKEKVSQEAAALLDWFASRPDYAELAQMAKGTIENAIRDAHREAFHPQK